MRRVDYFMAAIGCGYAVMAQMRHVSATDDWIIAILHFAIAIGWLWYGLKFLREALSD